MAEEEIATADWEDEALDEAWESLFPGSTAEPTNDGSKSHPPGWSVFTGALRWWSTGEAAKAVVSPKLRTDRAGEFIGIWPDAGMWDQRLPQDEWPRRLDLMADILGGLAGDVALLALGDNPSLGEGITGARSTAKDYEPCRDDHGRYAPCGGESTVTDQERGVRLDSARKLIDQLAKHPPTTEQTKTLTGHLSKLTSKQLAGLKKEYGLRATTRSKGELVNRLDQHLATQRGEAFHKTGLEAAARSIEKAGVMDAVRSGKPLSAEDLEKVSDVIHQEWMARERAREGGVRPDRAALMVPYKDLSEPEKEKDRVYALEAIAGQRPAGHWGSKEAGGQPFYRPGPNPTVDAVVTRDGKEGKEVLLIRRGADSPAEAGKWALPGGFHETAAGKGEPWKPGKETSAEAAARELHEETGLDLGTLKGGLQQVGIFDKRGRDPRDNAEAWSSSTAFSLHLPAGVDTSKVAGKDDADRAEWVPVSKLHERDLAFDHGRILGEAAYPKSRPEGKDTMTQQTQADGKFTPERAALHSALIKEAFAGKSPVEKPTAYLMGGGPASGKSSIIKADGGVKIPDNVVHIDTDQIKAKLPEYRQGVKDKDAGAAAFVHEESSKIAKDLQGQASKGGFNTLLDGTGDSSFDKLQAKVDAMREAGQRVEAHYATVDTKTAIERSDARAEKTGRFVPHAYIEATHASVSRVVDQAIKAGLFDKFSLWDNNGQTKKIAEADGKNLRVLDVAAWEKFLAKGK